MGDSLNTEILERILEVTRRLAKPFDLRTMLEQVIDAGRAVLEADRGSVFLYDAKSDELALLVATGLGERRFPADRGIIGECARTRRIVNVPDAYADSRFNPEIDRKTGYRTRCLLTIPLVGHDDSLVGVMQLLNKSDGTFSAHDETVAAALGAQCAVALQRVQMIEQVVLKEQMDRELALAREIQTGFLPREMPVVAGYEVFGMSRPADETGGDTFDLLVRDDGRLMLLLGDATGHGIGPALSVTQVRSMLRIGMRLGARLNDVFREINDQLADDLATNRFVTAFLGVLDPRAHTVSYHSGGQGPLMHFSAATGECEWHPATTVPLGLMEQLVAKEPERIEMAPGDVLGLITDGVFEYENEATEQFGTDRVARLVRQGSAAPVADLARSLLRAVREFGSGVAQADDITIVLLRRLPR